ncbi:uncharacterized protein LOC122190628 isoform X2 [Lagopus leucura]|uniref:uncharacterized protein LOC122190628 isoform X2 n=1 Tax=Lagopus leucura TaxID=30410 RepID=UPI001C66FFE7|nr:uncharacterized protein LOC122190628 isoform X2 [Lagopus leucura]
MGTNPTKLLFAAALQEKQQQSDPFPCVPPSPVFVLEAEPHGCAAAGCAAAGCAAAHRPVIHRPTAPHTTRAGPHRAGGTRARCGQRAEAAQAARSHQDGRSLARFPAGFWGRGSFLAVPNAVVPLQKFDWGTHFTINLTAREISCPAGPTAPRSAACRARPGQIQHCVAQISVFAFLPDVPLSLLECSRQTPSSSGQPRSRSRHSPATPRAVGLREPAPS